MTYIHRGSDYLSIKQDVEMEVDIGDIIAKLTDEEIKNEFELRFNVGSYSDDHEEEVWIYLFNKRRAVGDQEFLKLIDSIIMDNTGRIL